MNVVKAKDRLPRDFFTTKLIEIYREGANFDVDLIVSKNVIISAHKVILSMFSSKLRRLLRESIPDPKFNIVLKQLSVVAVRNVIELIYLGEFHVTTTSMKTQLTKALNILGIEFELPFTTSKGMNLSQADFNLPQQATNMSQKAPFMGIALAPTLLNKPKSVSGQHQPPNTKRQKIEHNDPITKIANGVHSTATSLKMVNILSDVQLVEETEGASVNNTNFDSERAKETSNDQLLTHVTSQPMEITTIDQSSNPVTKECASDNDSIKKATDANNNSENIDENIPHKLFYYDVDKATATISDSVNALMKDIDKAMEIEIVESSSIDEMDNHDIEI